MSVPVDGLRLVNTNRIFINNVQVDLNNLFNKSTHTTDDIKEGSTKFFSQFTTVDISNMSTTRNLSMGSAKVTSTFVPASNSDLTNKLYVDNQNNLKLNLTGGVLTGPLNGITPIQLSYLTDISNSIQKQINMAS